MTAPTKDPERLASLSLADLRAFAIQCQNRDGDLLAALGDRADRWAAAFCAIAKKLGKDIDEGWMLGWFANAIEHSSHVRNIERDRIAPAKDAERLALLQRAKSIYHEACVMPKHVTVEVIADHLAAEIACLTQERDEARRSAKDLRERVATADAAVARQIRDAECPGKRAAAPSINSQPAPAETLRGHIARAFVRNRIMDNMERWGRERGEDLIQQAVDYAWTDFLRDAEIALAAIEASGFVVVPVERYERMQDARVYGGSEGRRGHEKAGLE
jgi:hypothetical protein